MRQRFVKYIFITVSVVSAPSNWSAPVCNRPRTSKEARNLFGTGEVKERCGEKRCHGCKRLVHWSL